MDLDQLARALELFDAQQPAHLYLHTARVFLEVARREGCTFMEIAEALNITPSSVSRVLSTLGDKHPTGRPGFGWVRTEKDPEEGRRFLACLTPKGKAIAQLLQKL
jgi:DNA-binding MarR family transcriptional regulator